MSELKRELNIIKAQSEDDENRKNKMININSDAKEKIINLQTKIDLALSENDSIKLELEVKRKHIVQLESDRENLTVLLDSNKKGWDSNEIRMAELMKENQGLSNSVYKFQIEVNRIHEEKRN